MGFPGGSVVENPPANVGDTGDACSIPGSGRSTGGGNGNPLQYSCLENSMNREAWRVRTRAHTHTQSRWMGFLRRWNPGGLPGTGCSQGHRDLQKQVAVSFAPCEDGH